MFAVVSEADSGVFPPFEIADFSVRANRRLGIPRKRRLQFIFVGVLDEREIASQDDRACVIQFDFHDLMARRMPGVGIHSTVSSPNTL